MDNEQAMALALADEYQRQSEDGCYERSLFRQGAAELRRLHAEIERLRTLLAEAGALFRVYEQSHRAKGPGHEGKVERNAEIAGRIEAAVTPNYPHER